MPLTRFLVLALGAGQGLAAAQSSAPGTGQPQVEFTCTACHTTGRICVAQKSAAEWKATVEQMIRHGAVLTPAQATQLIQYLAAHFGKQPVPPARRGPARTPRTAAGPEPVS